MKGLWAQAPRHSDITGVAACADQGKARAYDQAGRGRVAPAPRATLNTPLAAPDPPVDSEGGA
jgi:hypothetical protein